MVVYSSAFPLLVKGVHNYEVSTVVFRAVGLAGYLHKVVS